MADASKFHGALLGNPGKKAFSLFDEFQHFAFKGNVVDLAVGVIIGGAFGRIIDSLVKQLIMPLLSVILPSEQGYADWSWTLNGQTIPYGRFLAEVINFLIIAFVLYVFIVKFLGWVMRVRKEEAAAAPPALTKEQELLTEIRDLMKAQA